MCKFSLFYRLINDLSSTSTHSLGEKDEGCSALSGWPCSCSYTLLYVQCNATTAAARLGDGAFKGEARIRVMCSSGGRRGRSRDDRQSAIAIVRTLPSPAAPCDPDRAYGRASRLPCRLFAAQAQQHSVRERRWWGAEPWMEERRWSVRGAAACGCRLGQQLNSAGAQPQVRNRPRQEQDARIACMIATGHGISGFGGQLGRRGPTRTDGLIQS